MSRKGNCWQFALMARCCRSLKSALEPANGDGNFTEAVKSNTNYTTGYDSETRSINITVD